MSHWCNLIMGCVCFRESVNVDGQRFYVKSHLGEGGFSFVDLIEDSSRKQFALKRIACHSKRDEDIAMAEVDYMKKLKHPNLVELLAAECIRAATYSQNELSQVLIVMPFYKRGTIFNELEFASKANQPISELRIMKLFIDICYGLQHIHLQKPEALAHRDVKPHNVLLSHDDRPVLMDFGSMGNARIEIKGSADARALQDLAEERCSMPYRAPELFTVESYTTIDERVDIWSLGCTLYAMCFYESPFDKAYVRGDSVALAVLAGSINFPNNSIYSTKIHDLIAAMLVINVMERPYIDWVLEEANSLLLLLENKV